MNYDLKLGLKLLLYPLHVAGVNLRSKRFPNDFASSFQNDSLKGISQIVSLANTSNFRDLGGMLTVDGRVLKQGLVYRSDHLDFVPMRLLLKLGVRTLVDFRSPREQKKSRNLGSIRRVRMPIFRGSEVARIRRLLLNAHRERFDGEKVMLEAYRYFAEEATSQYAEFFSLLSSPENLPLVFHCTAGKDRTGFATALLLKMLGVSEETILKDYLATNHFRRNTNRILMQKGKFFVEENLLKPLLEVQPSYLAEAYQSIHRRHGSFETYREQALGLSDSDVETLSRLYLQPVTKAKR